MFEIVVDASLRPASRIQREDHAWFLNTLTGAEYVETPVPGRSWPDRKIREKAIIKTTVPDTADAYWKTDTSCLSSATSSSASRSGP